MRSDPNQMKTAKANDEICDSAVAPLFRPFVCGPLKLANRIAMAPMTRSWSPNGVPGPDVAEYYRRRAANDVGLIITEGTLVNHPVASPSTKMPNIFGESLPAWKFVVDAVHSVGGKIVPQLWHVGITRDINGPVWDKSAASIAPSGINLSGQVITRPMSDSDISDVIDAFVKAAADAQALGFDGIELHGAHGYLIDQFFWGTTNARADNYGGDMVQRTRFATELVKAIRARVGPSFPIIMRLSQWKSGHYDARLVSSSAELSLFLDPISSAGVDIFHMSTRRFWDPAFDGSPLPLAAWTRKITQKPVITVGSVGLSNVFERGANSSADHQPIDALVERLERDEFDIVAVGRALLADPEWALKVKTGRQHELRGFSADAQKILL